MVLTLLPENRGRAWWHGVDLEPVDQELERLAGVLALLWLAATFLAWSAVAIHEASFMARA